MSSSAVGSSPALPSNTRIVTSNLTFESCLRNTNLSARLTTTKVIECHLSVKCVMWQILLEQDVNLCLNVFPVIKFNLRDGKSGLSGFPSSDFS